MVSRLRAALTVDLDPAPATVWSLLGVLNGLGAVAILLFAPIGYNRWLFATLLFGLAWAVELMNNRGLLTD